MKVLVASCVFPPEPIVSARTSFDIANFLHSEGHSVQVICPKPHRNVCAFDEDHHDFPFAVDRLFSISSENSGFVSRFIENISFGLSLFFYILSQRKIDAIYANTWPIFATGLLVLASKIKKFKVVISVQDLYPESLIAQGRISNEGVVARFLLSIDRWIAKNSHHIIVISESFENIYLSSRNIDKGKLSIVKNWVRSDALKVIDRVSARQQLKDSFDLVLNKEDILCVYGGNIGAASGLDVFVEYIDNIDPNVKFLFAGDGTHVTSLQSRIKEKGLQKRVGFVSPWPLIMTAPVLCAADILLLPTAEGQEFASVPSKLIAYMLSSRPVLLIAHDASESAQEVLRAKCGYVVSERTSEAVAAALDAFSRLDDSGRSALGESGRKYALENYSFSLAVTKINELLKS